MLGHSELLLREPSRRFLLTKFQHLAGGFSKYPGGPPDIYHAFLSLAALAIMGESSLKQFDPSLCVSLETARKVEAARRGLISRSASTNGVAPSFWADKQPVWLDEKLDAGAAQALSEALKGIE
jgi:geranylgeranyl transferase type-1 subunit beta